MIRSIVFVLALAQLTACSWTQPSVQPDIDVRGNQAALLLQEQWHATGRVLIRQPDASWQANLEWLHRSGYDRLVFSTALGGVAFIIERSGAVVSITDDEGVTHVGATRDLLQQYGFVIPLDSLGFWMRGLADPDHPARVLQQDQGWVTAFEQNDWLIYSDRFNPVQGVWWPHRITVKQNQNMMKYVVDAWN